MHVLHLVVKTRYFPRHERFLQYVESLLYLIYRVGQRSSSPPHKSARALPVLRRVALIKLVFSFEDQFLKNSSIERQLEVSHQTNCLFRFNFFNVLK